MQFSAVIRQEGELFTAWCPEVDVASQGVSVEDALANLQEAVELYLEDEDAAAPAGRALVTTFEVAHDKDAGTVGA